MANEQQGKEIPFPVYLDNFGAALKKDIEHLRQDSLKPSTVSDIIKCMDRIFVLQQMDVLAYTTAVRNWSAMRETLIKLEKGSEEINTKLAGYSERIVAIEGFISKFKDVDFEVLKSVLLHEKEKINRMLDT